ncbi:putative regulatory protein, FmdB family [Natronincola peptidivorans]|uniref:Putative regulatory protein, FmdB family n=1 Tax=Natronincola peptidivorans TaxID=426128 RepID=A0A1H9Y5K0_9FIRM|nr:zinc ribbon domain-containing protein [Natronincola peptidivorans]SES64121.1 putative regulatory protein, FmdB family [Natronincola peptidivorans]
MPVYEYRCKECNGQFEELRAMADMDKEIKCPHCGSEGAMRQISTFGVKSNTSDPPCKTPSCGAG